MENTGPAARQKGRLTAATGERRMTSKVALGSSASCTAYKALDTIVNELWPSTGNVFQRVLPNGIAIAAGSAGPLFPLLHFQALEHNMRSLNTRLT